MTGLTLYTWGTPNGWKISTYLEILQLKYNVVAIDILKNEQKQPDFLKLNPNGRIPTLVDHDKGITISQTGAILLYLAETYDPDHKFSYKYGTPEYWLSLEILVFQVAENGPIQGQANHFTIYAKEKIEYGIERYKNETKRIYGVFEEYLSRNKDNGLYLVGNHYSPPDFAFYGWAKALYALDIDIKSWPLVNQWFEKLDSLPEIQKGLAVPEK